MKMIFSKAHIALIFALISLSAFGQYREGKITYERRTNLYKTLGPRAKEWVKEKDKIKIEIFELTFTDSAAFYHLKPTDIADPMPWGTNKNTVFRDLNTTSFYTIRDMWGEEVHIEDELPQRDWKMTTSTRNIAGFDCRKAFWQVDDSTRIYAWYSEEIIPTIGPERFTGLPGAILGIASEDGGTVYFAKNVEFYQPKLEEFEIKRSKKVQNMKETREQLEIAASKSRWMKINVDHYFIW